MVKKRFLIGGIVVVLLVAAAIIVYKQRSPSQPKTNGVKTEVQISASGFSPNVIVVKPGTQIIWKNVDSGAHVVASNPYPSDSSLKELHSQSIPPNGTYSYIATKIGTINYHDDTQPTHNASIKVAK